MEQFRVKQALGILSKHTMDSAYVYPVPWPLNDRVNCEYMTRNRCTCNMDDDDLYLSASN